MSGWGGGGYRDPEDGTFTPKGAARGQSGGGSRAGGGRSIFDQYDQLTPEMKRQRAKERRMAKKMKKPTMDPEVFITLAAQTLDRLEKAFRIL